MKKLMIAAAASMAAVGAFAVDSANIVGYIGKNVVEGTKLVTASFSAIGEDGMLMSNLKPQGYEANQEMIDNGGTWGDFVITFLNEGGETIAIYGWEQTYESGAWNDDGAWVEYDNDGTVTTTLAPGDGIFVTGAPRYDSEDRYYLVFPAQTL